MVFSPLSSPRHHLANKRERMRMRVTCYINHFISQRFPLERIYIVKWAFHQKKLKEIDKLVVFLFLVVFITFILILEKIRSIHLWYNLTIKRFAKISTDQWTDDTNYNSSDPWKFLCCFLQHCNKKLFLLPWSLKETNKLCKLLIRRNFISSRY